MSLYGSNTAQGSSVMSDFASNPFQSMFFNTQSQMLNKNISQQQQSSNSTMLNNARQFGSGGSNPYLASLMAQSNRAYSGMQAQGFNSLLGSAAQNRMGAASSLMNFQPLQTGGSNVQTTSGLGTWLPQLIGGGLGALTGGLFGGGGMMQSPTASSGGMGSTPTAGSMGQNPFLQQQSSPNTSSLIAPPSFGAGG